MSVKCGHRWAYYLSSRSYMNTDGHGGMILTGEKRRTRRKTCPSATFVFMLLRLVHCCNNWYALLLIRLYLTLIIHHQQCFQFSFSLFPFCCIIIDSSVLLYLGRVHIVSSLWWNWNTTTELTQMHEKASLCTWHVGQATCYNRQNYSLCRTADRLLGPHNLMSNGYREGLSPGLKWWKHEADH
jgi:hypothetical protein